MELTTSEEFFINVYRGFAFLREHNYEGKEFCSKGREIWVSFKNEQAQREVTVVMEEPFVLNVYFEKKKSLSFSLSPMKFSLRDYYEKLGAKYLESTNDINTIASFIKQNLMSIITGEKWIDELLKQKRET